LNALGTSNTASKSVTGSTSGFFLGITKNDVPGMFIKLVNNTNAATLASQAVSAANLYAATTSGTIGGVGATGTASQTKWDGIPLYDVPGGGADAHGATEITMLVSGTHFNGPLHEPWSKHRVPSDCFQMINVREQEFGVLWCG